MGSGWILEKSWAKPGENGEENMENLTIKVLDNLSRQHHATSKLVQEFCGCAMSKCEHGFIPFYTLVQFVLSLLLLDGYER